MRELENGGASLS